MASWVKAVYLSDVVDGKLYFIGLRPVSRLAPWMFYSEDKSGKRRFTVKPGIAIRYRGGDELRKAVASRSDCCCVEVPEDADKRWRARR